MLTMLDLQAAAPEIFLAGFGMVLLILGVFLGDQSGRLIGWCAAAVLAVTLILVVNVDTGGDTAAFNGLFRADAFGSFMKALVLIGGILSLVLAQEHFDREGLGRFEFPVLVIFASLGMLLMLSANDLMSLYIGLELQSLSLYVMAAINRDDVRSTEAGLKYFVLGALSSGMLLYGASLVYGFAGSTNFGSIAQTFAGATTAPIGVIFGIVFVVAGLAFKVSAVPFHMWTPDVYEGAPTPVTTFFAAAPKVAAIGLFLRFLLEPFGDLVQQWQQVIVVISICSMVLGALAAINQTNIKRLMAYSSIGNIGYALIGLATGKQIGVTSIIVYMAIYIVMTIGAFACIIAMRARGQQLERIADLSGLSRTNPAMALALAIFMFSLAGIPPLAGFFGKLYVFLAAIQAQLYTLAVIGVLSSVVGAYYYIRIVKLMYFDESAGKFDSMPRGVAWVTGLTAVLTMGFFLWPAPLVTRATVAAAALFGG
jgi:NADH-quinone oxidoreductase subunit N